MLLPEPLLPGKLIRRYKRFLADVQLASGEIVTAHCPNSGSMRSLLAANADVVLSESDNPKRKLRYTWELVKFVDTWVGVNTSRTNHIVKEALVAGHIPELRHYTQIKSEAVWCPGTRFDFLLENGSDACMVEVKNVTLAEGPVACFPDSVTQRGTRHLQELMQVAAAGKRAVMLFVINRSDCRSFQPADSIDPVYGRTLRQALASGVEALVYNTAITPPDVRLDRPIDMTMKKE